MSDRNLVQPIAVLIISLTIILLGTFAASAVIGAAPSAPTDGVNIDGQSPPQYQPEATDINPDPEDGELSVDSADSNSRIVIDIRQSSDTTRTDLAPITEALFAAGHSVTILDGTNDEPLEAALSGSSGLLIVQPDSPYPDEERNTIQNYVDAGGHAVIAGEPTRAQVSGGGLVTTLSQVSFGATELAGNYGITVGSEVLYNVNDDQNDNNFKSIYATPARGGSITEGVDTITFDRSGHIITNGDDGVNALYTTVEGTKTIDTRRADTYSVVARNDSVIVVADGSFLSQPELYDADNEVFTSNLLSFLLSGDSRNLGG
ncbi:MAG: DUF4350 domain-containing protein [Halobellus sp.]|uniref:DUF4350 domain-containing protein n=1 Tax=Halobellus sp. TaxID=1979212 RepID=UPI0035D51991